jgi:lysophospholipase L1-like esterase
MALWPARHTKPWDTPLRTYIDEADAALQDQIDTIQASDVESVAGETGEVTTEQLLDALNLPPNTVVDLGNEVTARSDADAELNTRADGLEAGLLGKPSIRPNTVAILGASIAEMAGGVGVGVYDTAVASPFTRADGYFTWANMSLGGRLTMVKNAGVGGQRSDQILARVTDVTNLSVLPGYCILSDAASNDLVQSIPSATIVTNLDAICDALQAKGITVVICTSLPLAGNAAHLLRQEEVNTWIRGRATQPGFIVCDWAARWTDATTAGPKTGFATDGIHPTPLGAGAIGKVLADALRPYIGGSVLLPSHNLDGLAVNVNPMMVGTAGTVSTGTTGQAADNWTTLRGSGAGTMAGAKVARTDGVGGAWQSLTLAGGGGQFFLFSDVAGAAVAGTKWQTEMEFDAADFTGITNCRLVVEALTSGQSGYGIYQIAATALPTDVVSGVIRTPVFTVPAGGPFNLRTMLIFQGTAGSIRVSRIRTRKITS